jgi:hypothetical protein
MAANPPTQKIGDLCPECGEAAVVNEEGAGSATRVGIASVDFKKLTVAFAKAAVSYKSDTIWS